MHTSLDTLKTHILRTEPRFGQVYSKITSCKLDFLEFGTTGLVESDGDTFNVDVDRIVLGRVPNKRLVLRGEFRRTQAVGTGRILCNKVRGVKSGVGRNLSNTVSGVEDSREVDRRIGRVVRVLLFWASKMDPKDFGTDGKLHQ